MLYFAKQAEPYYMFFTKDHVCKHPSGTHLQPYLASYKHIQHSSQHIHFMNALSMLWYEVLIFCFDVFSNNTVHNMLLPLGMQTIW
jgi:hypothetical protein